MDRAGPDDIPPGADTRAGTDEMTEMGLRFSSPLQDLASALHESPIDMSPDESGSR